MFFLFIFVIGLMIPLAILSTRLIFPPNIPYTCGRGPLALGEYKDFESSIETMRTYNLLSGMGGDEMLVLVNCTLNASNNYWLIYMSNKSGTLSVEHLIEISNRSSWEGYLQLCCPGQLILERVTGMKNQMELDFILVCAQEVIRL